MSGQSTCLCPRCDTALNSRLYHELEADLCPSCHGVGVLQGNLIRILQKVFASISTEVDLFAPLEDSTGGETNFRCPRCRKNMENYGYMGTKQAYVNYCSACKLVWLDAQDLGAASILYARSERRSQALHRKSKSYDEELAGRTASALKGRALGIAVSRFFGG